MQQQTNNKKTNKGREHSENLVMKGKEIKLQGADNPSI